MQLVIDDEHFDNLNDQPTEEILERWLNYHLARANQPKITCLKDSRALIYVMNQLDDESCSLNGLQEPDDIVRAQIMIQNALALGCRDVVGPEDFV